MRHRMFCLAEWLAIDGIPSKDDTYDETRLVEMLWQIRLATGAPRRMSSFFKKVQDNFEGESPQATCYEGLNVDSAIEKDAQLFWRCKSDILMISCAPPNI